MEFWQEWNALWGEVQELDKELDRMRSDPGRTAPVPEGWAEKKQAQEASRNSYADTDRSFGNTGSAVKEPEFRPNQSPVSGKESAWNASALIIDEEIEKPDEEDLQCYQLRRRYNEINQDGIHDALLRTKKDPENGWDNYKSAEEGYLRIGQELSKGDIADETRKKMILLKNGSEDMEPAMKQFYAAFTLLQGSPSRDRITEVLNGIDMLGYEAGEALTLLQRAIAEAVALQDQSNSRQNRYYQERQDQYDSARQDAQNAYDKAKRRADRWR